MPDQVIKDARQKMQKALDAFKTELSHIRTGRASTGLVEGLDVEVYGSKMKLNQVASITAPEARLLVVQPWDKSQIAIIEKAIRSSPLDINPSNDGTVIRLPLPPLTEERRKELVKMVSKMAEEARVSVRNTRRTEMDDIKKRQKDGDLPEDTAHKLSEDIQKITTEFVGKIDEALKHKEDEIMEV